MANKPIYKVWAEMIRRCTDPKSKNWKNYGGRGITVCERWLNSFENFFADMGSGHKQGLHIDRIDTNGGYCKENTRWVTPKQNMRNLRRSIKPPSDAPDDWRDIAELGGLSASLIYCRVTNGWSFHQIVSTPIRYSGDPISPWEHYVDYMESSWPCPDCGNFVRVMDLVGDSRLCGECLAFEKEEEANEATKLPCLCCGELAPYSEAVDLHICESCL